MPAPVLDPTTSVLALRRGRPYAIQIALAAGSDPATSWAIASGGLPGGLTLNTSTGRISGTPNAESEGSVFVARLTATNGSGTSPPLELVFGIEHAPVEPDGTVEVFVDLQTGGVGFGGDTSVDSYGRPFVHLKRGDVLPLAVRLVKGSEVIDLVMTSLAVTAKEYEPETKVRLNPNGFLAKEGSDETARYLTFLELSDPVLDAWLANYEADSGTVAPLLGEIQIGFLHGIEEPVQALRTSATFSIYLSRDLEPEVDPA